MSDLIPAAVTPRPGDRIQAGEHGEYEGYYLFAATEPGLAWILLRDTDSDVEHVDAKFLFVQTERTVDLAEKEREWSGPIEHAHTDLPSGLYYATSVAADGEHQGTLAVGLTNEVWVCAHDCANVDAHRRGEVG